MTPYLLIAAKNSETIGSAFGLDARLFDLARPPPIAGRSDRFLHAPGRAGAVFFDGIAVFGETLVVDSVSFAQASGQGRGNFFLERHTEDGGIVLETDPLGFYPLVIYHEAGLFAASNSSALLARALRRLGRHVPRDTSIFAWFITQGSGFRDLTGFRGLSLLEAGSRVRIDGSNTVTLERRPWANLLYGSHSFAELLDLACEEILGNVRAVAAAPRECRVCELSGGMDSRLVLSAIVHEGLQDRFLFMTKGNYPNPDVKIAALIRSEFGLRETAHADPRECKVRLSPLDKLRLEQGRFNALKPSITGEVPRREKVSDHLSIGGGSGELLREFWSSKGGASGQGNPLEQKRRAILRRGTVLTPQARETLFETLRGFADDALIQRGCALGTSATRST